jgi:hypothetical protein
VLQSDTKVMLRLQTPFSSSPITFQTIVSATTEMCTALMTDNAPIQQDPGEYSIKVNDSVYKMSQAKSILCLLPISQQRFSQVPNTVPFSFENTSLTSMQLRCSHDMPICTRCARAKTSCSYPLPPDRTLLATRRNYRSRPKNGPLYSSRSPTAGTFETYLVGPSFSQLGNDKRVTDVGHAPRQEAKR